MRRSDSHRPCRYPSCQRQMFFATTASGRRRRIPLDAEPITSRQAVNDPEGVYYLEGGRAWPWTPMLAIAIEADLYRAHWKTCKATVAELQLDDRLPPDVAVEPIRLAEPPEPEPQLRMPVLPAPPIHRVP